VAAEAPPEGGEERPAPITDGAARLCREILAADPGADVRHVCSVDVAWAVGEYQLLSARERQVLELIAEGMTNREIAEKLFLAEKTVKNYVSRLLGKLGMSRRTQAAVYIAGMRHG
jgi:DNA-binding NarL/FixJ family response regulator